MAHTENTKSEIALAHSHSLSLYEIIRRLAQRPDWPAIQSQLNTKLGGLLDMIDPALDRDLDKLTGLPANSQLVRRLGSIIDAIREGELFSTAILYIDIDGFKRINDIYGHHAANEILVGVAKRISTFTREVEGFAARVGGDEFVVVIPNVASEFGALVEGMQLKKLIDDRYSIKNKFISVKASVGFCWADVNLPQLKDANTDGFEHMLLVDLADRSRILGKNCDDLNEPAPIVRYSQAAWESHIQRSRRKEGLDGAVGQGLFEIRFQPIVDLISLRIVAVELLVGAHWPNSDTPGADIEYLEDSGAIGSIWGEVLHSAQACLRLSTAVGDEEIRVNLNLAPTQLSSAPLVEHLIRLSDSGALPAARVTLEITERQELPSDRATTTNLNTLSSNGFGIACDDFSFSNSSALRIATFRAFTAIKIDMAMICQVTTNPRMRSLIDGILKSAHQMNMKVTAEGVTDESQAIALREMGCQYGQGYLYGKPIPLGELIKMLIRQSAKTTAAQGYP